MSISTQTIEMEVLPDLSELEKRADQMHENKTVPDIIWNCLMRFNGTVRENELAEMTPEQKERVCHEFKTAQLAVLTNKVLFQSIM